MEKLIVQIKEHGLDKLKDGYGEGSYGCDLHNRLYNEDYFVVGTCQASQLCGEDVFDIIYIIKEYELDNFGEVSTDFSDPEKVVNMFAYIKGEEYLQESSSLAEAWDRVLDKEDIDKIIIDLDGA